MRIGELAERVSLTPKTIRYYESLGLLPAPERTHSGYRDDDDSAVTHLATIRTARQLGMSLEQIAKVMRLGQDGHPPCG